ncbi:MAG: hypothetical protein ACXW2T_01885 [Allosphingosinicella sp.]
MTAQRMLLPIVLLAFAGCGERASPNLNAQGSTTPAYERADNGPLFKNAETPVRIGELGPGFAACNARGAARDRVSTDVPVSAAPFDQAPRVDDLPRGAEFFICSRTHDQRWFGIVYDEGGQATPRCGVSEPVAVRRDYSGPCAAGWVASSSVQLISGVPHQLLKASPPND